MTKGKAKMTEPDAVIFPLRLGQKEEEINLSAIADDKTTGDKNSINVNIHARFARLKKSMRKRSVSIL